MALNQGKDPIREEFKLRAWWEGSGYKHPDLRLTLRMHINTTVWQCVLISQDAEVEMVDPQAS